MKFYVYRHIRLDTNTPFYIGKGSAQRAYNLKCRSNYHKNIVDKVGCQIEILRYFENEQDAYDFEEFLIKLYKRFNFCEANFSEGGKGGSAGCSHYVSEETRLKMSISARGRIPWNKDKFISTEFKNKISKGLKNYYSKNGHPSKGKPSKLKGTKQSKQWIARRSEALKGRVGPLKGKKFNNLHKERISNSLKGIKRSTETRDKVALSKSKGPFKVINLKTGNAVGIWNNQTQCAKDLNINRTTISACLYNRMESFNNLKFEFITPI